MGKRYLVLAVLMIILLAASCGPTTPMDYQVLREWKIPAGGIGMELLVDESATKGEVLALAAHLRDEHSDGYIYIDIFDSVAAQRARLAEASTGQLPISEEEYWKHHLVMIKLAPNTGLDEILWVAEGRGY